MRFSFVLWMAVGLVSAVLAAPALGQIGFADNQADRIRLWNADYYELAFRKADGRLLYIIDKTTGQQVSPGNVHGPFVMRFSNNTWLDGENFSPTNGSKLFSYSWDAGASELTLSYTSTGIQACQVTIVVAPSSGPEVDMNLTLTNQAAEDIELLAFPVQLSFVRSQIEGVYMPYQEGMRFLPNFFSSYQFGSRYPGQMFADFAYTELTTGDFAVFCLHDMQQPLKTAEWLILRDNSYGGGVSKYHHDYTMALETGEQWVTPTVVLSVGAPLDEAMASYWTRSGHDAMPTLEQKLGQALYEKLAGAMLLKRDFLQGSWTFNSFLSYLSNIPADNLVHLVAFWPNGFDENYPDYLPPHPALGSLGDLQNLVAQARASGHLVMPYTNPTWWDEQAPTYAALGSDIVVRDRNGSLFYETYGGSHGGYVVTPQHPAVIARQDQTRDEFTLTVPCDLMFEDQVGARAQPTYDGNPNAPDPTQYTQGLLDVAARSASWLPIMTEGGFDRLSWSESGYCNSQTIGWHTWPSSTYTAYPMAPLWAHENLYFTAHNLAGNVMANDLPSMTYYLSMGYALSHDLSMLDLDWLQMLDCFQKHFVAPLVGRGMASFEYLPNAGQTLTTFADGTTLTANLTASAMNAGNHVVPPNGFIAMKDGEVRAGIFTTLHGQSLPGSDPHYLIFEYAPYRIEIRQPRGDDGALTVARPASWTDDARIQATAITVAGSTFARPLTISSMLLEVDYTASFGGQPVDYLLLAYCGPGDADCDGDSDLDDYAVLADCLAGPGGVVSPTSPTTVEDCLDAFDTDADLDIDLGDFFNLQSRFATDG